MPGDEVEAIYVGEPGESVIAPADRVGGRLRTVSGDVVGEPVSAADDAAVTALALGARSAPAGRRPHGRATLDVAAVVHKPALIVPPDCPCPVTLPPGARAGRRRACVSR